MNVILILFSLFLLIIIFINIKYERIKKKEHLGGALQSLFSNHGIQDTYLTINNDRNYYPYFYMPWNIPTRDLNKFYNYPYYQYYPYYYYSPYI